MGSFSCTHNTRTTPCQIPSDIIIIIIFHITTIVGVLYCICYRGRKKSPALPSTFNNHFHARSNAHKTACDKWILSTLRVITFLCHHSKYPSVPSTSQPDEDDDDYCERFVYLGPTSTELSIHISRHPSSHPSLSPWSTKERSLDASLQPLSTARAK